MNRLRYVFLCDSYQNTAKMTDSKENYTRKENSGRDLSHPTVTACRIPSFHSFGSSVPSLAL